MTWSAEFKLGFFTFEGWYLTENQLDGQEGENKLICKTLSLKWNNWEVKIILYTNISQMQTNSSRMLSQTIEFLNQMSKPWGLRLIF